MIKLASIFQPVLLLVDLRERIVKHPSGSWFFFFIYINIKKNHPVTNKGRIIGRESVLKLILLVFV